MNMSNKRIEIIGGGAAGLFAAASAHKNNNYKIVMFEKNKFTGKKLLITGKGRCNVTSACDISDFYKNIPVNPRFMFSSLNAFSNADTIDFFESIGVPLKIERGLRVFPASDKASDIRDALYTKAKENDVTIVYEEITDIIQMQDGSFLLHSKNSTYEFEVVIIATGGISYPLTGSTGDGYKFAQKLGHKIVSPHPSLVPIVCEEKWCKDLMGLSLKNVNLKIIEATSKKTVYDDFGEMIFTHYGISGPIVLSATSYVRDIAKSNGKYKAVIDLKPALTEEQLSKRLLSDFDKFKNKDFLNSLSDLLPSKLIPVVIELSGIDKHKKVNEITREERRSLTSLLKSLTLTIADTRPISEAIITSGGVSTSEINPKTMESKNVKNLYFIGEVIDVDAYTGGFNLQIAFSTAKAAINSILSKIEV